MIFSSKYLHIHLALNHFELLDLTHTRPFDSTYSDSYSTNLVLVHSLDSTCVYILVYEMIFDDLIYTDGRILQGYSIKRGGAASDII